MLEVGIPDFETCRPNDLVPWYLMSAYLLNCEGEQLVSWEEFDTICRRLQLEWDSITHRMSGNIDPATLNDAYGLNYKEEDFSWGFRSFAWRTYRSIHGEGPSE